MSHQAISICMAAYNEEAVIADTVKDCLTVLGQIPGNHEILVVNDGSTDRTGEILCELTMKYPHIRVLVHPNNQGIARARRWLIREASGDLIFDIAADGEWCAGELHGMLHKLNEGYDIVIGVRRKKHYGLYRNMVSWWYNMLVLLFFGKTFRDIGSIKLVRATPWKRIPSESNSAFFVAEELLLAHRNGARIGFVPVDHVWRSTGKSKFNNPLRVLEAFVELLVFWLSPRSRQKIDLWDGGTDPQAAVQSLRYQGSVKLPSGKRCDQHVGDAGA